MLSSYRVIKNHYVQNLGNKEINTEFEKIQNKEEIEENIKTNFESYETLVDTMLENARKKSDKMLSNAYQEAQLIESDSKIKAEQLMQEAYSKGYQEGSAKGYEVAYNENYPKVQEQCEVMKQQAEKVLLDAKKAYELYLEQKKYEIKDFILDTVETILKQAVTNEDSLEGMIFSALEEAKNAKSFIIKCHGMYTESLNSNLDTWKQQLAFKGDIFVLKDDSLQPGTAIIDKGSGKITVSIDYALDKLKELLEGNEKSD
jgi:flagellar assembly protein FliH